MITEEDVKYCVENFGKNPESVVTWSPSGMKEFLFKEGKREWSRYVFPETFKLFMKGEGNVREEGNR